MYSSVRIEQLSSIYNSTPFPLTHICSVPFTPVHAHIHIERKRQSRREDQTKPHLTITSLRKTQVKTLPKTKQRLHFNADEYNGKKKFDFNDFHGTVHNRISADFPSFGWRRSRCGSGGCGVADADDDIWLQRNHSRVPWGYRRGGGVRA